MKFPRWIQKALDALPKREEVMAEGEAREAALALVECLECNGEKAPWLSWIADYDGDEHISCLNCLAFARIVKKEGVA